MCVGGCVCVGVGVGVGMGVCVCRNVLLHCIPRVCATRYEILTILLYCNSEQKNRYKI